MSRAVDEMRGCLTDLKVPAKKADAIMEIFERLLNDAATPGMVYTAGGRVAVEYVEIYGLEIGVDACGNAESVAPIGVGWPQGFEVPELEYS